MAQTKKSRLWFIDAARSIAIIQMLQGHFIALTLKDSHKLADLYNSTGTSGSLGFDIWHQFRGFTAPLFFSITGLIFVYLLTGDEQTPFWQQKRVRKGLKRGLQVILWGYLLQINFSYLLDGHIGSRFYAFHVLHCIGTGILILIALHGVARLIKTPLVYFLFVGALIVLVASTFIKQSNDYFPINAPQIIQNFFHGPKSLFPLTPWLAFILLGGTMGILIRKYQEKLKEKWFPLIFILICSFVCLGIQLAFLLVDYSFSTNFGQHGWILYRFFEVLLLLGLLMYIQRIVKQKNTVFIQMGQNTLVIYILHAIVLHGAIIGIGVNSYINKSLTLPQALTGAIVFVVFFGVLTYLQPRFKQYAMNLGAKIKSLIKP